MAAVRHRRWKRMVLNRKDLLAGGFFIAVGAAFAAYAAITLDMGTSSRMGSGYFPVMLGLIMVGLGLAIVLTAERVEIETARPLPLRAIIALTLAPIVFGLTVRGLGLVAAHMLFLATVTTGSSR